MAFRDWAVSKLRPLLPLDEDALGQIVDHVGTLADTDAAAHFQTLLGDSEDAEAFVAAYLAWRLEQSERQTAAATKENPVAAGEEAPPPYSRAVRREPYRHRNALTDAANARAREEQDMQQQLQALQYQYGIYNSEIIPEHDSKYYCDCPIHQYQKRRRNRYYVMKRWSEAVQYPGEKCYSEYSLWNNPYWGLPSTTHGLPEKPGDDTMILLDVSGSMDFPPKRPVYDQYLTTGYQSSNQPKNRDVARAIVRRFTDALANHQALDGHPSQPYDLVTFSDRATYIGSVHHANFDAIWDRCVFGGRTRVMAGWQLVKDLHFQKHAATATHHPVYGWQAGPATPVLRLLLLLDGEAADMDEFELDLLGLDWAHVTVFLIGVDGCPHHHRHANELQRISDVNRQLSGALRHARVAEAPPGLRPVAARL